MKNIKYIFYFLSFYLLNGCVEENDIFNNEVIDPNTIIETSLILSYLNEEFITNSIDSENCFALNYPIQLSYNTGQLFTVESFDALEEITQSQSSNLHINGIILPFSATNNNSFEYSITSLEEFNDIFFTCNIPTLKSILFEKTETCVDFQYPFQMIDINNNLISIVDINQFFEFLDTTSSSGITPKFVFPITINENTTINNYFDLYEILNVCEIEEVENCLDIEILTEELETNSYQFSITSNALNYSEISWIINDETVVEEINSTLEYQFTQDGTYQICVNAITDNCTEFSTACTESIDIEIDDCTDLTFEYELLTNLGVRFTIPENLIEKYQFLGWSINDEFIEAQDLTSNEYTYFFQQTTSYEVCLMTETTNCPLGFEFCETIDLSQ